MPSSRIIGIPWVLDTVLTTEPKSILDVGIGFGKYGMLFREYLDVCKSGADVNGIRPENWKTVIDGIEIYAPYVSKIQRAIYDHIEIGDAALLLPAMADYDLIFLGDVIEHMYLGVAEKFLRLCIKKARKLVVILTPSNNQNQGPSFGNIHERHLSLWGGREFEKFKAKVNLIAPDYYMATIPGKAA